jgi:hypothetical protein
MHAWTPVLASVSERLGQPVDAWQRLPGGEDCAAFGNGQSVLKLMPPPLADCAERDTELLHRAQGNLPVAVPEVLALERFDGWAVVLLTRLPGQIAKADWPRSSRLSGVLEELGEAMAALHRLPLADTDEILALNGVPGGLATQAKQEIFFTAGCPRNEGRQCCTSTSRMKMCSSRRDDCLALQTSRAPVPEIEPWNSQHPGSFW